MALTRRGVGILMVAAALLAFSPAAQGQTVYVDDSCPTPPGSGTVSDPYCKIQDGICALKISGGTVTVQPGTYNESLRMLPGVSVISTGGPSMTTIDATGQPCSVSGDTPPDMCGDPSTVNLTCSAVVYGSGSTNADRLEGFHITGGAGLSRSSGNFVCGGGIFIYNSEPTITNNEIVNNVLSLGGATYFLGGAMYIRGINYFSQPEPQITNNLIQGNTADPPAGQSPPNPNFGFGGAIYIGLDSSPLIEGNTIRLNVAGDVTKANQLGVGGAISNYGGSPIQQPVISRNLIQENSASTVGGAIQFGQAYYGTTYYPSFGLVENNVIERNVTDGSGGAFFSKTVSTVIRSNTIADNSADFGGAFLMGESKNPMTDYPHLFNNIIAFNSATSYDGGLAAYVTSPQVEYNDFYGNAPLNHGFDFDETDYIGTFGNISVDPQFVDFSTTTRDLHLQVGSGVVDAGDDAQAPAVDFDGNTRVLDGDADGMAHIDMGAYELELADSDGDGILDDGDASGSTTDNPCAPGQSMGCDDNCTDVANPTQADGDSDGVGDLCDNCLSVPNTNQADGDGDSVGDLCDDFPADPNACRDVDVDTCDDCTSGTDDPANDGPDFDGDGLCDAGDPDDDNDGVEDAQDSNDFDPLVCRDVDLDTCDDCSSGTDDPANDGPDYEGDGLCDAGDPDDDNDSVADLADCDAHSKGVSETPGDIGPTLWLSLSGGNAVLGWSRNVQTHTYNAYKGTVTVPWTYNEVCLFDEVTARVMTDTDPPPAIGVVHYYLVGGNNVCGASRIGVTSGNVDIFPTVACAAMNLDSDTDGVLDVEDHCPEMADATLADLDLDFVGDLCDNCPEMLNPTQDDGDADLVGDICDCAAADPDNWAAPSEITGVAVSRGTGQTDLGWDAAADAGGTGAVMYDVLRSSDPTSFTGGTCVESDDGDLLATDTELPLVGEVFHYLVRAENSCPGMPSDLGRWSDGTPRTGPTCP